jgi:hypothetical protein
MHVIGTTVSPGMVSNAEVHSPSPILGHIWGTTEANVYFLDGLRIFFDFDPTLSDLSIKIYIPFYGHLLLS